jgi:hypothetical protein
MNAGVVKEKLAGVVLSPRFLLAILVGTILVLLALFVSSFPYPAGWDFRNNLWAPSYLLLQGQSPYNISVIYELGTAIWMPVVIGVFWPLGFLPLQQASNLWWAINLVALIAIVWISSSQKQPPKLLFVVTLMMAFIFPPTISHFSLGQITILVCLAVLVLANFDRKLHPLMIGILIAVFLSKPQLAIFILPGYLLAYLRENGFSQVFKIIFYTILGIGITSLPLFAIYPQWIPDFVGNLLGNPTWAHPSSLFILRAAFNNFGTVLWWLLLLAAFGVNLWLWAKLPKWEAVVWSLALTTLITPYVWSWDFVLLIPLLTSYLYRDFSRPSRWVLYAGFVSCWGLIAYLKLAGLTSDELNWWVPWYLTGMVLISIILDKVFAKSRADLESSPIQFNT